MKYRLYCPNCGKQLPVMAKRCPNCGAEIDNNDMGDEDISSHESPDSKERNKEEDKNATGAETDKGSGGRRKKHIAGYVAAVCAAALAIVTLTIVIARPEAQSQLVSSDGAPGGSASGNGTSDSSKDGDSTAEEEFPTFDDINEASLYVLTDSYFNALYINGIDSGSFVLDFKDQQQYWPAVDGAVIEAVLYDFYDIDTVLNSDNYVEIPEEEIKAVSYALFPDYDGRLPLLPTEPLYRDGYDIGYEDGKYLFMMTSGAERRTMLTDTVYNDDQSVDATLEYSYGVGEDVYVMAAQLQFHLVPNEHVKKDSPIPFYYRIDNCTVVSVAQY